MGKANWCTTGHLDNKIKELTAAQHNMVKIKQEGLSTLSKNVPHSLTLLELLVAIEYLTNAEH